MSEAERAGEWKSGGTAEGKDFPFVIFHLSFSICYFRFAICDLIFCDLIKMTNDK